LPSRWPAWDEVAGVDEAVGEGAVDRRAHRGEVEIALGLGERGLQLRKLGAGFVLLGFRHFDIVARGVIGRLRRFHRRDPLVASGFGHLKSGARGEALWCSAPAGARNRGPARFSDASAEVSAPGLFDRAFHRGDLNGRCDRWWPAGSRFCCAPHRPQCDNRRRRS